MNDKLRIAIDTLRFWDTCRLLLEVLDGHATRMGVISAEHQEAFDEFRSAMEVVVQAIGAEEVSVETMSRILHMNLQLVSPVIRNGQLHSEIMFTYGDKTLNFTVGKLDTTKLETLSDIIRLCPIVGSKSPQFMCTVAGQRRIVVPIITGNNPKAEHIPVTIDGVRYALRHVTPPAESEPLTHEPIENAGLFSDSLTVHVPDGPYKGYQGPGLSNQCITVSTATLDEFFATVLWKRHIDKLESMQVGSAAIMSALSEGWTYQPEPEKIEDMQYLQVTENRKVVSKVNPFFIPPAPTPMEGV